MASLRSNSVSHQLPSQYLQAAVPELYRRNAFRIAELPVDATPRELRKRQELVQTAVSAGLTVSQGRGRALPLTEVTPDDLRDALQRLNDPQSRLLDELFWFWPHQLGQSQTDPALQALAQGKVDGARDIWLQQEASSLAGVSMHNLAVLFHALALDLEQKARSGERLTAQETEQCKDYWRKAFNRWQALLNDEGFWGRLVARIADLDDPRLTEETAISLRENLPLLVLMVSARLTVSALEQGRTKDADRLMNLMTTSGFSETVVDEVLRQVTQPIRDRIKVACEAAESDYSTTTNKADTRVKMLVDQTTAPLNLLDHLLPKQHPTRISMHDEVALAAMHGTAVFGNETKKWKDALELLQSFEALAVSDNMKNRLKESIEACKSNAVSDLCWYCEQNPPDESASVSFAMHGNIQRSYGTIRYSTGKLEVPRCSTCKAAHDRFNFFVSVSYLIGAVLIGMVAYAAANGEPVNRDIDVWAITLISGFILGSIPALALGVIVETGITRKGIKLAGNVHHYPPMKELLASGWAFGEKPANTQ